MAQNKAVGAGVSEEIEGQDTGAQASAGGVDPAAVALALGRCGALDPEAVTYLKKQGRLADLQHEVLANCEAFEVSHLRWRRFGDQMKGALQIMGVLAGLCVVAAIGVMVWNAAHADGTVVESFAVPPDLQARGLTGEVVASQLLDKLAVIQTPASNSVNAAQALSASSANDVKVEIPDTGISIGELYRFLRKWMGHETIVGGEVVRDAAGLAVTVRVNGRDGASYAGPEAGLDALVQKAAEHVMEVTRPGAYATYLLTQKVPPRVAEAQAIAERVAADPAATPRQRAAAWNGLAIMSNTYKADLRTSALLFRRAHEADPSYALGYSNQVGVETVLGHPETALGLLADAMSVFERNHQTFTPEATVGVRTDLHVQDSELRGDHAQAAAQAKAGAAAHGGGYRPYFALVEAAWDIARQHDGGAGAWLAQQPQATLPPVPKIVTQYLLFQIEAALEHWQAVIAMEKPTENTMTQTSSMADLKTIAATQLRPWLALARARTGDIAGAEGVIATTPGDCYDCVRVRGQIASEAKQWGRADYWFAKAVHDAPSIPFAYEDWGRSLLARGQPDAAIEQFKLSNAKGPHFADPLEAWGEALMAKNQSHLALEKFAEAEKYAPNWGHLHLKWGEALAYAGKKDEAKTQFARAAQLDLTDADKAELARQTPHV